MEDCIIDISHHNGLHLDFAKAKADGIKAVIHKATQGTRYVDPRLVINRQSIVDAELLFGAYHFGTGTATGTEQADYFLESLPLGGLRVLDFEPNKQGPTMSIRQAQDFCAVVESSIGKPIVIYTGLPMLPDALQLQKGAYGNRPLWWAEYNPAIRHAPKDWPVTLWQYTESELVDGIGHCDRDKLLVGDLTALWNFDVFAEATGGMEGKEGE